jgi:hypothetical protein
MKSLGVIKFLYHALRYYIRLYIQESQEYLFKLQSKVFLNLIFKSYHLYWKFFCFYLLKRYYYVWTVPTFFRNFPEAFNVLFNEAAIDSSYVFFSLVLLLLLLISGFFIPKIDHKDAMKKVRILVISQSKILLQSKTFEDCPIVISFLTFCVNCLMRGFINCLLGFICVSYAYKSMIMFFII